MSETVQITVTRKVLDEFMKDYSDTVYDGAGKRLWNSITEHGYRSAREIRVEVMLTEEELAKYVDAFKANKASGVVGPCTSAMFKFVAAARAALAKAQP